MISKLFYLLAIILFGSYSKEIQLKNSKGALCTFEFPKGTKIKQVVSDDPTLDWLIAFPKNRKVFISNNDVSGSPLNEYKFQEYGKDIVVKIVANDSLTLIGKNEYGNWKEVKRAGIIYGYMNIPEN